MNSHNQESEFLNSMKHTDNFRNPQNDENITQTNDDTQNRYNLIT
jgi:hypothetical protein